MTVVPLHRQLIVTVALIEREGHLLIVRRHDPEHPQWHQRWGFPGGKIEPGETPLDALHREVKEETALTIHAERLLGVYTHHWHTPKGVQQTFLLLYHCQANAGDVQLNLQENDAYAWEQPQLIVQRTDLLDGNIQMLQELFLGILNGGPEGLRPFGGGF